LNLALLWWGARFVVLGVQKIMATDLEILFEDKNIVAVNKPAFLPSHVTLDPARPHLQGMLEKKLGQSLTLFHRLDVDTTGIVLFGKTPEINKPMSEIFLSRDIKKAYWAVVQGRWLDSWREVRTFVRKTGGKWANFSKGRPTERAITHFKVIKSAPEKSWIEAELETGKTHQIRLHCLEMGHPVLGDRNYGRADSSGIPIALHAVRVEFTHPITNKLLKIEAPLPSYWQEKWIKGFNVKAP
jgi:RluA family pseudouridine synthase